MSKDLDWINLQDISDDTLLRDAVFLLKHISDKYNKLVYACKVGSTMDQVLIEEIHHLTGYLNKYLSEFEHRQ